MGPSLWRRGTRILSWTSTGSFPANKARSFAIAMGDGTESGKLRVHWHIDLLGALKLGNRGSAGW